MSFRVLMTEQAIRGMQSAFNWWAEHRSKEQADRWYNGLAKAIDNLSKNPTRHRKSRERDRFDYDIRDLLLGLGRRRTHRVIFTIRGEEIVILTIRHTAQ